VPPAFAGFLLPAALLGALLLSEFADGCGLLGRVDPLEAVVVTFFSVLSPAEASPSQTTSVTSLPRSSMRFFKTFLLFGEVEAGSDFWFYIQKRTQTPTPLNNLSHYLVHHLYFPISFDLLEFLQQFR